ncbi:hypothetical protein GCM10011387_29760 [Pedobacter quisquiliarum]|jgi:hypothetical protein|uniref:YdhG-like domain-containing protein n=1 Tax=Pedobacter quisquiliarum TaxID=1834438 RepID=A0A916XJ39_9SPHI|nr:DUF1801 domain-containing protein [Pedobacter quisquiliarum]GGC74151.1 hypothetical protein GCM10011387_29760 [Pedobacter quisquiliarum]
MAKQTQHLNNSVTEFLNSQIHQLRNEIEELRKCILSADDGLIENIKWNGPNYCFNNEDRITMRIQPPTQIQLIFHRGAKKLQQPLNRLIDTKSKLLIWKENDRAIATFKNMQEIRDAQIDLAKIVVEWIYAAKST